ncbi:MAG: VOC family protein, partial [Bacteroidales bacterium]|nr:VOC family protein [Bacteroidales bacterium]
MKPTHIEHLGIAVRSLETAIPYFENILGLECYAIEEVAEQKVKTAFFKIGQTKIELLESTDPEGPVGKFIESRGEGVHHIAFAVENLQEKLDKAAEKGVRLIDKTPRK